MKRRPLLILAAGHACADCCQGAVPALIPFLVADRGLTFAQAGVLVLVMALASSLTQPLIGIWSDRRGFNWPIPAGVALAATGIATLGFVHGLGAMAAATATAGLGVALFHPDAARSATAAAGERAASGLSLFALGGTAGFALAPVLLTPAVLAVGLKGTAILLLPALVVATTLARMEPVAARAGDRAAPTGEDHPRAFAMLVGIAALRAGAFFTAQAFLAATIVDRFDVSKAAGNAALAGLLIASAIGTLAGGRLADHRGHRFTIAIAMAGTVPGTVLVLIAPSPVLAGLAAIAMGFCVSAGYSPTIIMGQRLLPSRPSLAAGTMIGFAIGIGGAAVAALGPLADSSGPGAALAAVGVLTGLGAVLALAIPTFEADAVRDRVAAVGGGRAQAGRGPA